MLVALGLVAWAAPADATCEPPYSYQESWAFTEHATGMPATADPERTLASADLDLRYGYTDRLAGTVTLAAAPTAETDADLVVAFGQPAEDGTCTATPFVVTSTHSPETGVVRDGATFTFDLRTDLPHTVRCAWVAVTESGDGSTVQDRLEGVRTPGYYVGPWILVELSARSTQRVPVGRWSTVGLRIDAHCYVDRVRLVGKGRRAVDARTVWLDTAGRDTDGTYRVRMPVRLNRSSPRYLKVLAVAFDAEGRKVGSHKAFIKLRPRR